MEINGLDQFAQGAQEAAVIRPRNHRLRRGVYLLPSFFTVGNLICGYYSILATLEGRVGDLDNAARAIGVAFVLDALDGGVARATGTNTEFGKQFDSLADVVSFGIAPAFLAYAWGVRDLPLSDWGALGVHVYQLGWLVCFIFLACCAWRLARFNIQGMAPGGSRYFVGLPTPAAAGMIAATVHATSGPVPSIFLSFPWLALILALGILMASTLRYYSFKDIQWRKRHPSLRVVALAGIGGAVVFYSRVTLLLMASIYVAHGPVLQLIRTIRHRRSLRPA